MKKIKKLKFKEEVKTWSGVPAHWRYAPDGSEDNETYKTEDLADLLIVQNVVRLVESTDAHFQSVTSGGFRYLLGCDQYFNRPNEDDLDLYSDSGIAIDYIRIVGGDSLPIDLEDDEDIQKEIIATVVGINEKNFLVGDDALLDRHGKPVRINIERMHQRLNDYHDFSHFVNDGGFQVSIDYDIEGRKKAFVINESSISCEKYKKELDKNKEKKNDDSNNTGS